MQVLCFHPRFHLSLKSKTCTAHEILTLNSDVLTWNWDTKFCFIVGSEPPITARIRLWSSGSHRAPMQSHNSAMQPHKHNFPHYQGKAPGFTLTWQCRVSGLSVPWLQLVVSWFNSCAAVSDCCLTHFGLRTRNTLCGKGPTAPVDSKTQKKVTTCIPCQTFPRDNELCFDTPLNSLLQSYWHHQL